MKSRRAFSGIGVCLVAAAMSCGSPMEYHDERGSSQSLDANGCAKTGSKLAGDTGDDGEMVQGDAEMAGADGAAFALLADPDYQSVVKPQIIDMYCTNACHAAGKPQANIDLTTYAAVKNLYSASLADMQSGRMPTGPVKVPADKIALFQQWSAANFPEKAAATPPGPTPTPAPGKTPTTGSGSASSGSGSSTGGTASGSGGTTNSGNSTARCLQ